MVAGAGVLEVKYKLIGMGNDDIVDLPMEMNSMVPELDTSVSDVISNMDIISSVDFIPTIRSGSFADIGPRRCMEDANICIDDLSPHLSSFNEVPKPNAFYGVFDGHGGAEAAAYVKEHAVKLLFQDVDFPLSSEVDEEFSESVEETIRKSFHLADLALAEDRSISSSCGTTALTALVLGRLLLVANAGDCRAVLCRNGKAFEMSQDHRPVSEAERQRIERSGGYVDDGYLNGVLSVARALGDWEFKSPGVSPSALISEPEFRRVMLTEDDEFLIIGCDGIWDVMSSQLAISIVREGLLQHNNPEQCARELVKEALRLDTSDNLTVVVVCFSKELRSSLPSSKPWQRRSLKGQRIMSDEAFRNLQNWLD